MKLIVKLVFLLTALLLTPCLATPELVPERTHAIIVGVLEWATPRIPAFPKQSRQDEVFVQALLDRGVPESQIEYLQDSKATKEEILRAFSRLSDRTQPGDTLIFYYTGHGTNTKDVVRFYEYDALPGQGLSMSELSTAISENFTGTNVLLFADCCFSGGLSRVSESLQSQGYLATSLTSATDDAYSGPTWTYTMALIDCFRGLRPPDGDLNHKVTLQESREEIEAALAYTQRQILGYSLNGLSPKFTLSYVTGIDTVPRLPEPFQAYDYGRLRFKELWRGVRLMDYQDPLVSAQLQEYASRPKAWLPLQAVRPNRPAPEATLGEEGEKRAALDGRYQELLTKIEVRHDHLDYEPLHQSGFQEVPVYGQHLMLPKGYWVYLYPYWYIWEVDTEAT